MHPRTRLHRCWGPEGWEHQGADRACKQQRGLPDPPWKLPAGISDGQGSAFGGLEQEKGQKRALPPLLSSQEGRGQP